MKWLRSLEMNNKEYTRKSNLSKFKVDFECSVAI